MTEKRNTITRSEFERILKEGVEIQGTGDYEVLYLVEKFGQRVRFSPGAVKENADRIFGR